MLKRFKRLIETFIAKKFVAWGVSIPLLIHGYMDGQTWALFTAAIFGIDYYSKKELMTTKGESTNA